MKLSFHVIPIIFLGFLAGCYSTSDYLGDGQLIDNGIFESKDRYVLKLGDIDFNKHGNYDYNIIGLPPDEEFIVGFELTSEKKIDIFSTLPNNAEIFVRLTENQEKILFEVRSKLNNWVWNTGSLEPNRAFIYVGGENSSYFNSNTVKKYKLTISILQPNTIAIPTKAKLLAKSGGWK
ncbi:MAG: hypothetical protein RLT30_11540 [Gammaproteobacteria bacterium]